MTAMTKKHEFDEVFDTQKVYRQLLTAISNPLKPVSIKEHADKLNGLHPELLALAMTLLDNEVGFCVEGSPELSQEIAFLTLAKAEAMANADYIFILNPSELAQAIGRAKCGTLSDPHKSATIIVYDSVEVCHHIRFYGAGVDGKMDVEVSYTVNAAIKLRDEQAYEYPQGVDFIFISANGELTAIPRLTLREVL